MDWTKLRGATYIIGFGASGVALFLQAKGWATYDGALLTIHPFDPAQVATQALSWVGNGLAALAVFKAWGRK